MNRKNENQGIQFRQIAQATRQDFVLPEFTHDGYPQISLASKRV